VSPRVLVTGAAGFIGSHVCEALVGRGDEVVGVDNFDPFYARAMKERNLDGLRRQPRFRFLEADVARDPLPLDGVTVVLHLAAKPGVRPSLENPASYSEANVTGTVRVLEAARRAAIGRVVFGSSSSVYGDATPAPFAEETAAVWPISPYAASKRAGELMAHAFAHLYGMHIACLRFFTVYGPRQRPDLAIHRFTDLIARGSPVRMHGDGSAERDYTYITDCVGGGGGGGGGGGDCRSDQHRRRGAGAAGPPDRVGRANSGAGGADRATSRSAGRRAVDGGRPAPRRAPAGLPA